MIGQKGLGESASPVFDDGARLTGELLFSLFDLIPTYQFLLTPHPLSKAVENVILNEVKNLGREEILQSLRSFRMTKNHYRMT